jgi:hypothetical protein
MKPSILIIADFPNWAYHEIQQFVKNNVSDEFDIYCDYLVFNSLKKSKHPFKRFKLFRDKLKYQQIKKDGSYDIVVYLGFYFDKIMKIKWTAKKIIKGIYTENFPPKNAKNTTSKVDFYNYYLKNTDALVCGTDKAKNTYKDLNIRSFQASAIKSKHFFKRSIDKKINNSNNFIIGWTGNPNR